jgi:branched-chain amino acid transport system substrate-binding protein
MKGISQFALVLAVSMFLGSGAVAGETIPIGVPLAMTGAYTGSGDDYFKGIKMAIDEINEAGGLLGKQLEIIRYDSKEFAPEVVMQGADYLRGQKNVASVHAVWAG